MTRLDLASSLRLRLATQMQRAQALGKLGLARRAAQWQTHSADRSCAR